MENRVLTIDGASGVGKGTLARFLARELNWNLLDSGSIYRLAALYIQRHNLDSSDPGTARQLYHLPIDFVIDNHRLACMLEGEEVTAAIRSEDCGMLASNIAQIPRVRAALLDCQRHFADAGGLVADGRDMGTVVFPEAVLKFYLTASAEARAERRYNELLEKRVEADKTAVLANIQKRDQQDRNRSSAPLKPAEDAVVIDTGGLNIEQVRARAMAYVKKLQLI